MWPVMLFTVRAVGLVLLSHASSSRDLAFLLVLLGLLLEQLWPYLELLALVWEARSQHNHAPAPLILLPVKRGQSKADALAEITRKTTEEALAKLRQHLQEDEKGLRTVTNKLLQAGDKNREAMLVEKFVKGSYTGLPEAPEEDGVRPSSWWKAVLKVAMGAVGIAAAVALVAVLYSR